MPQGCESFGRNWATDIYLWHAAITRIIMSRLLTQLIESVAATGVRNAAAGRTAGLGQCQRIPIYHRSRGCYVGMERSREFRSRVCAAI